MAHWRVQQWSTFARMWYYFDARHQCVIRSGERLAIYLQGKQKPIYEKDSDLGDSIVVVNCRHISAPSRFWHNWHYYDHGNFPKPLLTMTMAELHCYSPTEVIMREVRGRIRNTFRRRELMARLHLFADGPETLPQWMLACLFARIPPVSRTPPAPLSSEDITALRERTYGLQPRGEHAVISDYLETGELPPLFHLPDSYVRERSAFYLDIKPDTVKK